MDTMHLEGGSKSINLYPWLDPKLRSVSGDEALSGIEGFGLPPVTANWFEGAGAGKTWRNSHVDSRPVRIPLWVYATSRTDLNARVSELATVLNPDLGQSRLYFGGPSQDEWWIDVVRIGGGDWKRKVDSDDRTYFKTDILLEAGDPFWTRDRPESFDVRRPSVTGPTFLPKMARMRLSSGATFGSRTVENQGDTYAWPVVRVTGPTDLITMIGPKGERVVWDADMPQSGGALELGDVLTFDFRWSTVTDQNGDNRYGGLQAAPHFWPIAPGSSTVTVEAANSGDDTSLNAQWWPRRWAMV